MILYIFSKQKLHCFDDVIVDGYAFMGKNRDVFKNRSGGVGILIKNNLFDIIHVLDNSWCKLKD